MVRNLKLEECQNIWEQGAISLFDVVTMTEKGITGLNVQEMKERIQGFDIKWTDRKWDCTIKNIIKRFNVEDIFDSNTDTWGIIVESMTVGTIWELTSKKMEDKKTRKEWYGKARNGLNAERKLKMLNTEMWNLNKIIEEDILIITKKWKETNMFRKMVWGMPTCGEVLYKIGVKGYVNPNCKWCEVLEDIKHVVWECKNPEMRSRRKEGHKELKKALGKKWSVVEKGEVKWLLIGILTSKEKAHLKMELKVEEWEKILDGTARVAIELFVLRVKLLTEEKNSLD